MINSCLKCKNKDIDKNNPECKECELRVQYVKSIGPMTCTSDLESEKTGDKNIMENVKEKVCKTCGNQFPATTEYFHANKKASDGLQCNCKTCRSIHSKEYRKARRLAVTGQPQGAVIGQPQGAAPTINRQPEKNQQAENILSISFADYPEILEEIKKIAKEEFRNPEQQILFWISGNFSLE